MCTVRTVMKYGDNFFCIVRMNSSRARVIGIFSTRYSTVNTKFHSIALMTIMIGLLIHVFHFSLYKKSDLHCTAFYPFLFHHEAQISSILWHPITLSALFFQ